MKTEVGEATKYHSFCVGEGAPESSSIPSPPPSPCPSTLRLHCLRHSLKSKHLFFPGPVEWVQHWATRGGWRHHINLTYLQSSQWSPQLPCSSWQPNLCGQICWHLGTTCRRQFPLPSGSSFWAGVGPGLWHSGESTEHEKTLFSQPQRWTLLTVQHYKVRAGCCVWKCGCGRRASKRGTGCVYVFITYFCVCGCVRKSSLLLCVETAGSSWDLHGSSAP